VYKLQLILSAKVGAKCDATFVEVMMKLCIVME